MYPSEGAEQVQGAGERIQRALDRVATAESALAQARRELAAAQRAEYGWTDGLAGRRRVADALTALAPRGWTFVDAVHWPGRPGVVIDHVGVGPGGVVVMFSRQWTGVVEVRGGVLRQNGIPRLREANAVSAAAGAVCALLDPAIRATVSAFVCAVQHDVRPATVAPGVNVVGVRDVGAAVAALQPRLTADQVDAALDRLHACLVGQEAPDQLTTRALTVYEGGPALPWPPRVEQGLFDPSGAPSAREPGAGVLGPGEDRTARSAYPASAHPSDPASAHPSDPASGDPSQTVQSHAQPEPGGGPVAAVQQHPTPAPHAARPSHAASSHAVPPHAVPPHAVPPHAVPPHAVPPHAVPPQPTHQYLDEVDGEEAVEARGRHRAPSRHAIRTATGTTRRATRGTALRGLAARRGVVIVAGGVGGTLLGLLGWLAGSLL